MEELKELLSRIEKKDSILQGQNTAMSTEGAESRCCPTDLLTYVEWVESCTRANPSELEMRAAAPWDIGGNDIATLRGDLKRLEALRRRLPDREISSLPTEMSNISAVDVVGESLKHSDSDFEESGSELDENSRIDESNQEPAQQSSPPLPIHDLKVWQAPSIEITAFAISRREKGVQSDEIEEPHPELIETACQTALSRGLWDAETVLEGIDEVRRRKLADSGTELVSKRRAPIIQRRTRPAEEIIARKEPEKEEEQDIVARKPLEKQVSKSPPVKTAQVHTEQIDQNVKLLLAVPGANKSKSKSGSNAVANAVETKETIPPVLISPMRDPSLQKMLAPSEEVLGGGGRLELAKLLPLGRAKQAYLIEEPVQHSLADSIKTLRLGVGVGNKILLQHLNNVISSQIADCVGVCAGESLAKLVLKIATYYAGQPGLAADCLSFARDLLCASAEWQSRFSRNDKVELLGYVNQLFSLQSRPVELLATELMFMMLISDILPVPSVVTGILIDQRKIGVSWTMEERMMCLFIVCCATEDTYKAQAAAEILADMKSEAAFTLYDLMALSELARQANGRMNGVYDLQGFPLLWPHQWARAKYWVSSEKEQPDYFVTAAQTLRELLDRQSLPPELKPYKQLDRYLQNSSAAATWLRCALEVVRTSPTANYHLKTAGLAQMDVYMNVGPFGALERAEWRVYFQFLFVTGEVQNVRQISSLVEAAWSSEGLDQDSRLLLCELDAVRADQLSGAERGRCRTTVGDILREGYKMTSARRLLMIVWLFRVQDAELFTDEFVKPMTEAIMKSILKRREDVPRLVSEITLAWCARLMGLCGLLRKEVATKVGKVADVSPFDEWSEEREVLNAATDKT